MAQEEYDFQIIANLMAGRGEAGKELERIKNFVNMASHPTSDTGRHLRIICLTLGVD